MEFETNINQYKKVIRMAKTPGWEEFSKVSKISLAFLTLVGAVGFSIFMIMSYLPG
jgi:protein transport protein SEC61 subunit gamma-like protein